MVEESKVFTVSLKKLHEASGMKIWFDWPNDARPKLKPSFFKQTLIAIMVVLPLIFAVGSMSNPPLSDFNLPLEIEIAINVIIVSPLITLIMPRITKLLHPWLYPK